MSEIKPNCEWPRISVLYQKSSNTENTKKDRVPGPWRICSSCKKWVDETIITTMKKYLCFNCLK